MRKAQREVIYALLRCSEEEGRGIDSCTNSKRMREIITTLRKNGIRSDKIEYIGAYFSYRTGKRNNRPSAPDGSPRTIQGLRDAVDDYFEQKDQEKAADFSIDNVPEYLRQFA